METTYIQRQRSPTTPGGDDAGLPLQSGGCMSRGRALTDSFVPVEEQEARILVRPARASVVGQNYKFTNFQIFVVLGVQIVYSTVL